MRWLVVEPLPLLGFCRSDLPIGTYWPLAVAELPLKDVSCASFATAAFAMD